MNTLRLKRTTLAVLCTLLLSAAGMTKGWAYDFSATYEGQTLYFSITDAINKYVTITYPGNTTTNPSTTDPYTNYTRPTGALSLPSVITNPDDSQEYTVTAIGDYAFYRCTELTGSLAIPSTVTSIGRMAFYYCNNQSLNGTLTLPNGLLTIGDDAFDCCTYLYQGEENTYAARTLTIPSTVTSIGAGAFYYLNYIYKVDIPSSVTYIGQNAFRYCQNLRQFTIPTSVSRLGMHAFTNTYRANQQPDGVLYLDNCLVGWKGTAPTGQLVIPEGTRLICDNAFNPGFTGNNGISLSGELVIPNTVLYIGYQSFQNCTGLTKLTLGRQVYSILNGAFWNCNGLDGALILPASTAYLYNNAFGNCTGIDLIICERYTVPSSPSSGNPLSNIATTVPIYVPAGSAYSSTEPWKNYTCNAQNRFSNSTGNTNENWSTVNRWTKGAKPTSSDVVCIMGSVTLDEDANPLYVYYASNAAANKITIPSGKTLAPTYGIRTFQYTNMLYIEDGGQLVNPFPIGASGTAKREILGYVSEKDNYYFIATPTISDYSTSTIASGTYDLYSYDEPTHYWWYDQSSDHGFNTLANGQGYLYANSAQTTINFSGQFQPSTAEVAVDVTASAESLKGFNLVGNPYTHNITPANLKIGESSVTSIYKIDGDVVAIAQNDASIVKPTEGFFVQTSEAGVLSFNNTENAKNGYVSDIKIEVSSNDAFVDRAYVNFHEGQNIDKFTLGENCAKLYFRTEGNDYAVVRHNTQSELPLHFEAKENGVYTINVKPEYVEMNQLRLIDNMTGVEVDLLATPSYTFNAKKTDYASRFRLVFSTTGVEENGTEATFAYFNGSEWVINGSDNATLEVIDMMGRTVLCKDVARNVSTNGWAQGVYVIRLTDNNSVKTQKIVVR